MIQGVHNALRPAGPQAERLAELTWFLTAVVSLVFVLVMAMLAIAVWRARRRGDSIGGAAVERKLALWVGGGLAATLLILVTLLFHNFITGRALAEFADPDALTLHVTGHQWWWEIEYRDPSAHRRLVTANEIYIPVGRRVRLQVESGDVIHSFWVPNLHGKLDLTPGYTAVTYLQADSAGIYRGRCAEFCGMQHAHMDFLVIAVPPAEFERWFEHQLRPAPTPTDSLLLEGREVFLSRGCVLCHTIRGTPAGSNFGPDLTHIASRQTLGAGTVPNRRGHLAGWIVDPQRIKPGVRMPPNELGTQELHALLAYLESLQ